MFGEDVSEVVGAFKHAANDEGGRVAGGAAVAGPDGDWADDVDEAGFVFKVEERDAASAAGTLAVSDDAGDCDPRLVVQCGESGSGGDAALVELVA